MLDMSDTHYTSKSDSGCAKRSGNYGGREGGSACFGHRRGSDSRQAEDADVKFFCKLNGLQAM